MSAATSTCSTASLPEFLAACHRLLALRGQDDPNVVILESRTAGRVLRTPGITIIRGPGLSLEITVRYLHESRDRVVESLAIVRNEKGVIVHQTNEWVYAVLRVQRLLAGAGPVRAIRVGIAEDTRDCVGLD